MTEVTAYSLALSIVYLFVAVTAFWALLRWLDRLAGLKFSHHVMPAILDSARATAIYFGARIVAVAIVVSAVLG